MKKEEIQKNLSKVAYDYAKDIVEDAENHEDAVEVIASDFISGASYVLSNLD